MCTACCVSSVVISARACIARCLRVGWRYRNHKAASGRWGIPTARDRWPKTAAKIVLGTEMGGRLLVVLVWFPAEAVDGDGEGTLAGRFIEGCQFVVEFDIASFFGEPDYGSGSWAQRGEFVRDA